jgi:DNA-binding IscR family transcriptional regulator
LRDHGLLLVTGRGPGAGWRLARPAAEITLAELHSALAEHAPFELHPHEPKQTCPVGYGIRPVLSDVYAEVETAIRTALGNRSIADVLNTTLAEHPLPMSPDQRDPRA